MIVHLSAYQARLFPFFKSEKEALYVDVVSRQKRYGLNYLVTWQRTAKDFAGRRTKGGPASG
jgi:hypothetical protein